MFKFKIEAHHVNAGLYMAFKYCISFVTDLDANFGCYQNHARHRLQAFALCHLK